MSSGHLLLDRGQIPDAAAFESASGTSLPQWRRLVAWVRSTYGLAGEPLFGGRDDGWALRFRRSGRSLMTLIPGPPARFRRRW